MASIRSEISAFDSGQVAFIDYDPDTKDVFAVGVAIPDGAPGITCTVSGDGGAFTADGDHRFTPTTNLNALSNFSAQANTL